MDIHNFYKSNASHWENTYNSDLKPSLRHRMEYCVTTAKAIGAERILDAGCGTGQLVEVFAQGGFACDGLDLSDEMLEIAARRLGKFENTIVKKGDLSRIEDYPSDAQYDLITAMGVFVHQIDEIAVLRAFHDKLSSDGRIVISFKNGLFSLFTLNENSREFLLNSLSEAGVSPGLRDAADRFFAEKCTAPVLSRNPNREQMKAVFNRFHNPLTISNLLGQTGFELEDIHFLNFHPAPPIVMCDRKEAASEAEELYKRYSGSWPGHILASSFLARARKV